MENLTVSQSLSLWERWHCGAMTERARMLPEKHKHGDNMVLTRSQCIAVGRLCRTELALSGAHAPALPKGEPSRKGKLHLKAGETL